MEDIEPQPIADNYYEYNGDEYNDNDSLGLLSSDILEFLSIGDFDVGGEILEQPNTVSDDEEQEDKALLEEYTAVETEEEEEASVQHDTKPNTTATTVTSNTTASAESLPNIEFDFGSDSFLADPDQLHSVFDAEENEPREENDRSAPRGIDKALSAEEPSPIGGETDGSENFLLDVDLETQALYRELANMTLSAKDDDNDTKSKAKPKKSAMDLLLESGVEEDGLPFGLGCQPCTPADTDAMIRNSNIFGEVSSDLLGTMLAELAEMGDPGASATIDANPAVSKPSTNAATTPSTMDLLLESGMDFADAVGTDGLPFYLVCQPCTPDDTDALIKNNTLFGAASSMGGMLQPIGEDQPLVEERSREERVTELRALYMASAAVNKDDLIPLDHNDPLLDELESHQRQQHQGLYTMQDDYQQLANELRYQQQQEEERRYYASWRDAQHWAKAFGVDLEDTHTAVGYDNDQEDIRRTPKPKNDASKSGLGHKEVIYGISFSEDGKYVATASQDATIGIWEVATNRLLKSLKGHDTNYECLRVDWAKKVWGEEVLDRSFLFANLVASSGADGTVKLWACKDRNGRDDQGLKTIDNDWKCEYTLDHASLFSRNESSKPAPSEEEEGDKNNNDNKGAGKESDNKPQVYSLQFIDHWKIFTKELQCPHHSQEEEEPPEKQPRLKSDDDKNSFLMTSSDDFIHLWEVQRHTFDQQLEMDGQKIRILQEKIKLKEVMSLHFGPLDQFGYGVTVCSMTGEGLKLPPPPAKTNQGSPTEATPFGGERNPDNTVFVFEAAYSPNSGLLGVALSDGSLRLVNGRGSCISVINLPGNRSHLTSFCWDSTGNRLATCVGTGHLITWSLDAEGHQGGNYNTVATCTAILEGGHDAGRPLFGSKFCGGADENLLLSWGVDGKLCMWYSKAQGNIYEPVAVLKDDANYPIYALGVSASERNVVVGGGGSEGGFIGIPLHFYKVPPVAAETKVEAEKDDDEEREEGKADPNSNDAETEHDGDHNNRGNKE